MRPRLERNDADRGPGGDGSRARANADGGTDGNGSAAKRAIGPQRARQLPRDRTERTEQMASAALEAAPAPRGAGGNGRPKAKADDGTDAHGNDAEAKGDGGPRRRRRPMMMQPTAAPMATAAPQAAASSGAQGASGPRGAQGSPGATTFQDYPRSPAVATAEDSISTFSLDTDRTSYYLALNWAQSGFEIDPASVRAEEWVNSFDYAYERRAPRTASPSPPTSSGTPWTTGSASRAWPSRRRTCTEATEPLNVTLVLDASGSMGDGNRVAIAREAAESIRRSLRSHDRISVVHFTTNVIHEYTVGPLRPDDRDVKWSIAQLAPHGSTNVQAGLDLGVRLADQARRERPDAFNYIVLMSDGVANVDATDPFAILESTGGRDDGNPLRLITVGVGINNYNDYLLEQLAQHGNGWYRYLSTTAQARETFGHGAWLALSLPFADQTRAQVTWDPDLVRSWRIIGYENRITSDESFTQDRKEFAEIPSGAATTVFYELDLEDGVETSSAGGAKLGDIELRWVTPVSQASNRQHAPVWGHWGTDFGAMDDARLRLGTIAALAADRYSALPYADGRYAPEVRRDLSVLMDELRRLERDLGTLEAYRDFAFLLDHIVHSLPAESRPGDSGYSR